MALKRIYIDIDSLLDTRLGVLNMIAPEAAQRLMQGEAYWDRENDDWDKLTNGVVTNEQFKEAWDSRGGNNSANVLNGSVLSNLQPFVMRILTEDLINRANQMGDEIDDVGLTINVWPYALSLDEKEDMRDIAEYLFGATTHYEIVDIPLPEVTVGLLADKFAAAITYNFLEWIRMHHEDLGRARLNCFNFIGPRIFEQDVSKLSIDEKKTILDVFRLQYLMHMDFEFIDARHFSMFRPTIDKSKL